MRGAATAFSLPGPLANNRYLRKLVVEAAGGLIDSSIALHRISSSSSNSSALWLCVLYLTFDVLYSLCSAVKLFCTTSHLLDWPEWSFQWKFLKAKGRQNKFGRRSVSSLSEPVSVCTPVGTCVPLIVFFSPHPPSNITSTSGQKAEDRLLTSIPSVFNKKLTKTVQKCLLMTQVRYKYVHYHFLSINIQTSYYSG